MGKMIIEKIRNFYPNLELIAIGTNSIATSSMMKAGADFGATGENPVVVNSTDADIIIGPIGIVIANSLFGEITPIMAEAVGKSKAQKILIPVNKCNLHIAGQPDVPLTEYISHAVEKIKDIIYLKES